MSGTGGGSFSYDGNGNMTSRTQGSTHTQLFDVENRLIKVTVGSQATHFYYDPSGQRTMTLNPTGTTTYDPFPTYQETRNGSIVTNTRATYMLAGQAVAVRTNGLFYYLLNDHLGSASMTVNRANGNVDQRQRYLPFGGTRTAAGSDLAGWGYTGHLHNDGVGLIYTPEWVCAVLCAQLGPLCQCRYDCARPHQPPTIQPLLLCVE